MDPLSSPRIDSNSKSSNDSPPSLKHDKTRESINLKSSKGILEDILSKGQLNIIVAQLSNQLDLGPTPAATTQGARGPQEPAIDPELIESLAIAHKEGGNKEIRVQLKNSALAGTELFISRDAEGLNIRFVTTSEQSNQALQQNLSSMQTALKNRLPGEKINVEVSYSGKAGDSEGEEDPDYFIRKT